MSTVFRNRKNDVKKRLKSVRAWGGEGDRGLLWSATTLSAVSKYREQCACLSRTEKNINFNEEFVKREAKTGTPLFKVQ